jgi:hypothetical protein
MWDFSISRALGLMGRTAPFVVFRIIVYFGISAAFILITGTGAGIGYGVGLLGDEEFHTQSTFWGAAIGFGGTAGVLFFLRDYLLYIVKAGHIAVMVELLEGREVPQGHAQIDHARAVVTARFGQASALFVLDQLIRGVVTAITGLLQGLASILPMPGLEQLMGLVRAWLRLAVGLVDEVILAHAIRTSAANPWSSAQEALVLYAQNARPMLVNAAWLALITWGLSLVVFLVMLAPAALVVWLIPGQVAGGVMVFALLFAWAVKATLIEPFALACLLQVYFRETEGQTPDPDWMAQLQGASDKFRSLGERAKAWASGHAAP